MRFASALNQPGTGVRQADKVLASQYRVKPRTIGVAFITLALAGIVPLLIVSSVLVAVLAHYQHSVAEERALRHATAVLDQVDRSVAVEIKLLQWFASSLTPGEDQPLNFEREARRAIEISPNWCSVALIEGRTGHILDTWPNNSPLLSQTDYNFRLDETLKTPGPHLSGYMKAGTAGDQPGVLLWAPVPQNDPSLLVGALIGLPALRAMLDLGDLPSHPRLKLVDQAGAVLADTSSQGAGQLGKRVGADVVQALSAAAEGSYGGQDGADETAFTVYKVSESSGWSVHFSVPSNDLDWRTGRPVLFAAIGGFSAVLLSVLLIVVVMRDLAHRRKTDDALQQSRKMELIGQMTGGIAHDFNNLLTIIGGNLDLLEPEVRDSYRLTRMVQAAIRAAQRGAQLTEQLLAYSRRQRLNPVLLDVNRMVGEIGELITRAHGEPVVLHLSLSPELGPVKADTLQLQSAILNLILNARDAMPQGGTLMIQTRNVEGAEVTEDTLRGPAVEIAVADTGTGMAPEVSAHASEPFFTTKEIGKGSGLGLSQVFGFVEQSGGHVMIESQLGAGTTVRIVLPRALIQK